MRKYIKNNLPMDNYPFTNRYSPFEMHSRRFVKQVDRYYASIHHHYAFFVNQ